MQSVLLWVALTFSLAFPCFLYDLRLPDEPRVAHTSWEMLRTGDFIVPTVNGEPFLQTPPLHYWALAMVFSLGGTDIEGLARIPSAIFSWGTLAVIAFVARRHLRGRTAFLAAAVLGTTVQFWDTGHRAVVDTCLTFFTTLGFSALLGAFASPDSTGGDFRAARGLLLGLWAGLAFLAKGAVGPGFLALTALALAARGREILRPRLWSFFGLALASFAVVAGPYVLLLWARSPAYAEELFLGHVKRRFLEGAHHEVGDLLFAARVLGDLLPWTLVLPLAARHVWRGVRGENGAATPRLAACLAAWILLPAGIVLLSRSKRDLYLLPVFPAISLAVAGWLERTVDEPRWRKIFLALLWALAVTTPVGAALLAGAAGASAVLVNLVSFRLVLATMILVAHFYGVVAWLRTYRRRGEPAFMALCLLVLAICTWGSLDHAMKSPNESLARIGGLLRDLEGGGSRILGYALIEREIAAVAWQLRHPFERIDDGRRILDRLKESGTAEGQGTRWAIVAAQEDLAALRALPGGEALDGFRVLLAEPARRRVLQVLVRG